GIKLYYYTDGNIIKNNYIYNNSDGIEISYKNHTNNVIHGNYIYNNRYNGIFFDAIAENNTIMDNEIYDNENNGIYIKSGGQFNSILNCDIYSNGYYGIRLENSINNTVSGCTIYSNGDDGISIYSNSMNNSISNCNIYSNNDFGIWISTSSNYNNISNCNIYSNNNAGVGMGFSSIHNVIYGCNIYDNEDGVYISSSNNVVSGCNISSNNYRGINIQASSNEIKSNYITGNQYGIYIGSVNDNLIYNNYFNNTINAYDEGNNIWNISKTAGTNIIGGAWLGGNYWHDYAGDDTDGDDLGDTMLPYNCSGNIANGGDWHPLLVPTNHPPAVPYNPTPSDGVTGVELDITLQWQCYDPDGDALSYDVYFGSLPSSLEKKASNITSASYSISNLQYSTTYYWRVVAWDEYGAKSIGPVWSFTTKENTPPTISNPHPVNGSVDIAINPTLAVDVDDVDGDTLTVTFYDASDDSVIGTVENVSPGGRANIEWPNLQYSTTYSWYVKVSDGIATITSPIWSFTTKAKPQYTLVVSINPEGAGSVSMNPAGGVYEEGTVVTLTATANEGYVFAYWSGDASGTNPTIQITMNSNKNVIANFQLPNTPPEIEILSPSNGSVVSGSITIQGKAWDEDGNETIQKVEIRIDGGEWKAASGTVSWYFELDTTKLSNGIHVIEARCYDGIDYSNIAKISIDVNNVENTPPEINVIYPVNESKVSGTIIIKGKAWDKDGNETITKVEIKVNDEEWKEATGTINWAYTLDTTKLSNGNHTIYIRCYDGIDYSKIITITINVQNKEEKEISWVLIGSIVSLVAVLIIIAVWFLRKR
ncbi:MAG: right-handed parallel beta-helix repeat-containing protein, partial [Thermoplasmata archaeon]|nr:right-handed parallel beta-helix repeat-containing protein [Thermoplasmata archaeon]